MSLQASLRERVAILLVEPETAGNVGSIARLMKNFGFSNLIILNPQWELDNATYGYAMHGRDVLEGARIVKTTPEEHFQTFKSILKDFDLVIGTSGKGEHYSNLKRAPIYLEDFKLPELSTDQKICIIFGKESRGLTNEEISCADFVLRIRTHPEYPILNLSHAAGLILYQIFLQWEQEDRPKILMATREQKERLNETILHLIERANVRTFPPERVLRAFQNVFGRAFITQKEIRFIYGLLHRLEQAIDHLLELVKDERKPNDICGKEKEK